jgi:ATP-dependent Lon protease
MRFLSPPSGDSRLLAQHAHTLMRSMSSRAGKPTKSAPGEFTFALADRATLDAYKAQWRASSGEGAQNVRALLSTLDKLPVPLVLTQPPKTATILTLSTRFPNFAAPIEFIARAAALSNLPPLSPMGFSPLLLQGPPGIGKTQFARELAKVLSVPMIEFSFAHATGPFALGGLDAQYAGGGPGYLVRQVAASGTADALVLIDEIDKAAIDSERDAAGPLYSLLESTTAARFVDDGLRMPMNLSALRWVCTSNDHRRVHPALLSRCTLFEIPPPTPLEVAAIAQRIYKDLLTKHPWGRHFAPALPSDVARHLSEATPRDLGRVLRDGLGAAALAGRMHLRVSDVRGSRARPSMGFSA